MYKPTKRVTFGVLLALLIVTFLAGTAAAAYRTGTVITKTGVEYKAIVYSVDKDYRLVKVIQDEKTKNISFKDIQAIYNDAGENVAGRLLGGYYKPIDMSAAEPRDTIAPPVVDSTLDSLPPTPTDTISDSLINIKKIDNPAVEPKSLQSERAPTAVSVQADEPKEDWLSQTDPAYAEAHQARWNAEIILSPTFTIPAGDYYNSIESGIGFSGGIRMAMTYNIALRFDFLRTGMHWDDRLDATYVDPISSVTLTEDWSLSVYRWVISGEYYLISKKNETTLDMLYFGAGLGSTTHSTEIEQVFTDETGYTETYTDKFSQSKFTLIIRIGGNLMLSQKIGVDMCLTAGQLFIGKTDDSYDIYGTNIQYAYNIDLSTGLVIAF